MSTPGAIRAARAIEILINGAHARLGRGFGEVALDELAEIIDVQTGAPELLAALKQTLDWLESFSMPPTSTIQEKEVACAHIRAAIEKAEQL